VPAMAVALKRAFVSTNGSIMTVVRGYRSLISGQTAEQAALARTDAALATTTGATERLALADQELTGASLTTGGGGVSGLGRGAAGIAGKLGLGAFTASMAMPVLNQLTQKRLQHLVGKGGQADLGDAAAGALTGMYFGPEGALAGAGIGALYGDRGHLARQLEVGGHDLVHGLDAGRHLIAHVGSDIWHDIWGGGSSS